MVDFPDPSQAGSVNGQNNIDTSSPQFQSAQDACRSLAPAGGSFGPPQASGASVAAELKFAECMRAHGLANFPDPNAQGSLDFSGIDRNSPQYQQAWPVCRSDLPNNGAKTPAGG